MTGRRPLRILFATPAYWPATSFGGPTRAAKELTEGLVRAGNEVNVLTTSLRTVNGRPAGRARSVRSTVGGVDVLYLATPLRYRWMGITPTLPFAWPWRERPDIVHVFGYRDVVTTLTAAWARSMRIPYVFEPLDMFVPQFRNVPLKRAFDRALGEPVAHGAALVVACSSHEQRQLVEAGLPEGRIRIRLNGFPAPPAGGHGALRARLGLDADDQLVLSVGRISFKKGLDLLVDAVAALDGVHLAIVGPDDGDGTLAALEAQRTALGVEDRVHLVGPLDTTSPSEVYGGADVFVLRLAKRELRDRRRRGGRLRCPDRCHGPLRDRGDTRRPRRSSCRAGPSRSARRSRRSSQRRSCVRGSQRPGPRWRARTRGTRWSTRQLDLYRDGARPCMADLTVVGQDPGFGGGALARR